ncbi:hypothetical protein BDF14DRAFT_1880546 [Spinellus fusiger]|nr:hypothetical protein BDF14DRAFT_1880546 [Spinellus fusiger]
MTILEPRPNSKSQQRDPKTNPSSKTKTCPSSKTQRHVPTARPKSKTQQQDTKTCPSSKTQRHVLAARHKDMSQQQDTKTCPSSKTQRHVPAARPNSETQRQVPAARPKDKSQQQDPKAKPTNKANAEPRPTDKHRHATVHTYDIEELISSIHHIFNIASIHHLRTDTNKFRKEGDTLPSVCGSILYQCRPISLGKSIGETFGLRLEHAQIIPHQLPHL